MSGQPTSRRVVLIRLICPICGNAQVALPDTFVMCYGKLGHQGVQMVAQGANPN